MYTSAVLEAVGGWYSSHWSIASASRLTGPFTITSSTRVNQPLAALQDLYGRAVFLLGITSGLPSGSPNISVGVKSPAEEARETPDTPKETANRVGPKTSRSLPGRENLKPQSSAAAVSLKPQGTAGPTAVVAQPEPASEPTPAPEDFEAVSSRAEVLIEAVNRLGAALEAHEFLNADLRQQGAELISRFAQALSPFGLSSTDGSLSLDREQLAKAYQENPGQTTEAYWGQNSLTPEIVSLAAAIVGAPGTYLMEAAVPQESYQPYQAVHPWFRVAPACFQQVA
jgi:hypothetical protein